MDAAKWSSITNWPRMKWMRWGTSVLCIGNKGTDGEVIANVIRERFATDQESSIKKLLKRSELLKLKYIKLSIRSQSQ